MSKNFIFEAPIEEELSPPTLNWMRWYNDVDTILNELSNLTFNDIDVPNDLPSGVNVSTNFTKSGNIIKCDIYITNTTTLNGLYQIDFTGVKYLEDVKDCACSTSLNTISVLKDKILTFTANIAGSEDVIISFTGQLNL